MNCRDRITKHYFTTVEEVTFVASRFYHKSYIFSQFFFTNGTSINNNAGWFVDLMKFRETVLPHWCEPAKFYHRFTSLF